ncbi:epoxide hydrolase family protein [Microbacterium sp.]|jgi:pimeloyl-ACP methyl ester carboxylesterase|uniref:epoxide hydrolase family protein n=1 Tax=Microbacterium sp. TaxID=51671 RepID=UPI0037C5AFF6
MTAFRIDIPQTVLDDLEDRLARTRWPDSVAEDDWSWGTDPATLRTLVDRWTNGYDWRATEARLNELEHVRIGSPAVHAVRAGTQGTTPLLLVHGWPDSFLRFEKALPLLADRFDIVVPSIPGFGFSERPTEPGSGAARVADLLAATMSELGFERFVVHGGDVGSTIAETIAHRHADRVIGVHLGDVPFWHRYTLDPASLDDDETAWAASMTEWSQTEGAYALLQRTKPQTIAYALTDSPIGLAAWYLEKFRAWSDNGGDVFRVFTPDELLDDITLYWVTSTAGSAARYYRDSALYPPGTTGSAPVPAGFAIFPRDIHPAPRVYAERYFDVRRWTQMPRGGHFGPWEQPELFARELRGFVDDLS